MSNSGQSNSDRIFPVFNRGEVREDTLDDFRLGLLGQINPDTGQPFTAEEIAAATASGSTNWKAADSLDLVLLAEQQRGLWMGDQVIPTRASTSFLQTLWGPLWLPNGYLPASGGSGPVSTTAVPGTVWKGSTTVPDPTGAAVYGTDPAGLRYQVLFTTTADVNENVALTLQAIDTGANTNLVPPALIAWANAPVTATSTTGTVLDDFTGGLPAETDAGFAKRIVQAIRHKPAAGNNAQQEQWAATISAVENGWIYACALNAGSIVIAITQNRGNVEGPLGRIPSAGTLAAAVNYLTAPGSPVQPGCPFVFVVGVTGVACDVVLTLQMPVGSPSGWDDLRPFPGQVGGTPSLILTTPAWAPGTVYVLNALIVNGGNTYRCTVPGTSAGSGGPTGTGTGIVDNAATWAYVQSGFLLSSPVALPTGVTAPEMMVWNAAISRFEELNVLSVVLLTGTTYTVQLAAAPVASLAAGAYVSPYSQQIDVLGETIEIYFDGLGPGEVVNLLTDPRGGRAYRYPVPSEEFPQIAGSAIVTPLEDALGAALATGVLDAISVSTPAVPADPTLGPNLLVAGRVCVSSV